MLENPEGFGTGEREAPTRKPRAPKKQTAALKKSAETREGHMATVGRLLPAAPMTADELAEAWLVAADDAETITVKVLRYKPGTQEMELVSQGPLTEFDGEFLAGRFGPGTYYLRPAAGPYAKHSAKLPISETLARSCGYGRIQPTATELVAERTIRDAATGPTDPLHLVAAIEAVMDKRDRERGFMAPQMPMQPGQAQTIDPLAAMRSQFEQIQSMMSFMGSLEERAIKTVEMRMGRQEFTPSAEDTNTSLLEKLLPKALDIFGTMMSNRNPAPLQHQQAPGQHQVSQAQPEPPKVINPPTQEAPQMPTLTQQEQEAIGGAVAMLRPHGNTLVQLGASGMNDDQIITQLEPWIPGPMVPELANLAAVVAQHGPAVLGAIHPGLAVDRWAGILPKLVSACQDGE